MAKGFVKLPTETIQHISSFLPLENQVVLALSCKLTLSLLGSLSWTGVKGVIKLRLLGLLARDMPRATVCFQCGKHMAYLRLSCEALSMEGVNASADSDLRCHTHLE